MEGPKPYLNKSGHSLDVVGLSGVRPPVDVQSGDGEGASHFRLLRASNEVGALIVYLNTLLIGE